MAEVFIKAFSMLLSHVLYIRLKGVVLHVFSAIALRCLCSVHLNLCSWPLRVMSLERQLKIVFTRF